ncbi:D-glycero-alpha-D-manno-heptose-1,7-bisphosphate 7-phosphatase [Desulfolutivibrio sulfoxidireducens]|uniref:D-glycero-alpha-D-manno-heptose-1,7-bisphosphate 7-phosphatase n=1 Tax=Desulfolutivibrio sulfoxidireducens TaxID=2773299 RepID=UPI00159E2CB1|nr:HAD family hydrolase [Desulfolutivibrio sulfoxidireducens]QLA19435.1 HAD-IIIA family hydrolase [Desulfolutivibrio sulfoxidireducens]
MSDIEAVLLDRDGTVIEDEHYLGDPARVRLIPGAAQALARLQSAGMRLFLVSNQSGLGRGYFTEADYLAVHTRLMDLLAEHGVHLTDATFCPHAPDAGCACRKPRTGQWDMLRARHTLQAATTAVIGDKASDIAFGQALGARLTILALTGHGRNEARKLGLPPLAGSHVILPDPAPGQPDAVARDLAAAVDLIATL